jgi:8-oxo-dGTP pyrophosphatase MutT (NUDIX family)
MTVRKDSCETEDGHIVDPYFALEFADWVQILAFDKVQNALITRQYRHGVQKVIYGLPTGFTESSDSNPLESARRELIEETGYDSKKLIKTGELFPNPAIQNNRVHCYAAFNVKKIKEPDFDHSERISIEFMALDRLMKMISEGTFSHALHVAGVYVTLHHLELMKYDNKK